MTTEEIAQYIEKVSHDICCIKKGQEPWKHGGHGHNDNRLCTDVLCEHRVRVNDGRYWETVNTEGWKKKNVLGFVIGWLEVSINET